MIIDRSKVLRISQKSLRNQVPLVAHIIHRLDIGGLEQGLVNIINFLPSDCYRHAIVCLTGYTKFISRIRNKNVSIFALHKREGIDFSIYAKVWRLLRRLRPDIVHTHNLSTLETLLPVSCAGVRCRIHSEHGREGADIDGKNRKYNILRRAFKPLVHRYIALSDDLALWLKERVGVSSDKIIQISTYPCSW